MIGGGRGGGHTLFIFYTNQTRTPINERKDNLSMVSVLTVGRYTVVNHIRGLSMNNVEMSKLE